MRSLGYGLGIVTVWMLAWGSVSVANALSGAAVAVLIRWLAGSPASSTRATRIRLVPALKFAGYVVWQVVQSNVTLARQVFMPMSRLRPGVLAVPLPPMSDELLTTVVNLLALTPGTVPLSTSNGGDVLYVHVLHMTDVEAARREVLRLVQLASNASGGTTT